MHLNRVTNIAHPMYQSALELYKISFPPHEQREAASQECILKDSAYHFDLVYDATIFVGLILYWETPTYIYIEHFCTVPEMRNKRYGEKTLAAMKEKGKTLILEIDLPIDAISKRRKGFYERCGFVENSYSHIHPPYHKENIGHELAILSYPEKITVEQYQDFTAYLHNKVMNNVFAQ